MGRLTIAWDNIRGMATPNQITVLLEQWGKGDQQALEQLRAAKARMFRQLRRQAANVP